MSTLKRIAVGTPLGRAALVPVRVGKAAAIASRPLARVVPWAIRSREYTNFTFDVTETSHLGMCSVVAAISDRPLSEVIRFADEVPTRDLADHVARDHAASDRKWSSDPQFRPGRRLFYYLLVRALRPEFTVEAGVDKGLGAVLISEAIRRNQTGDYLGIEFNPLQACSLYETYPGKVGRIERGDSVEVLKGVDRKIDLFIHETSPDPTHVTAQLAALRDPSVIATPWPARPFTEYALTKGKKLLTHQEEPVDHWHPGSRLLAIY